VIKVLLPERFTGTRSIVEDHGAKVEVEVEVCYEGVHVDVGPIEGLKEHYSATNLYTYVYASVGFEMRYARLT
jgi:hypothetical protein